MLPNIDDEPDIGGGPLCHVAATYTRHPDNADQIRTEIDDRPDRPATTISRWLRHADIRLSAAPITRHRRHDCACQ